MFKTRITAKKCILPLLLIALLSLGCKKLVDVPPPYTSLTAESVYIRDATAIAAITGMYIKMGDFFSFFTGTNSFTLLSGLSSDELTLYSGVPTTDAAYYYYQNDLLSTPLANFGSEHWAPLYNFIFTCNSAIDGLNKSTQLSPYVQQQLLGEAKFIRAFCYFYLVNLYGDVPLVITPDYSVSSLLPRTTKPFLYQQIIADLKEAQNLLSQDFLDGTVLSLTTERVRPTKWAATALLARTYLYSEEWSKAEEQATSLIANTNYFDITSLDDVFLKNSKEAIWQLQPVISDQNTQEGAIFILPSLGPNANGVQGNPVYLSDNLLSSFEVNDLRKANWIDSVDASGTIYYYPYKYKASYNAPLTEYLMVFRLGEQYLIRAESRARQSKSIEAENDLNMIRTRAGLPDVNVSDPEELLNAILHERRIELFTEWGHRWLDLKRTNNIDAVMTLVTPGKTNGLPWRTTQQLYPLPIFDLQANPNLVQNPGY